MASWQWLRPSQTSFNPHNFQHFHISQFEGVKVALIKDLPVSKLIPSIRTPYLLLSLMVVALLFIGEPPLAGERAAGPEPTTSTQTTRPGEPPAPGRNCQPGLGGPASSSAQASSGSSFGQASQLSEPAQTSGARRIADELELNSAVLTPNFISGDFYNLAAADAMALSVAFTQEAFADCAAHIVVAETVDLDQLAIAAWLAAYRQAPLLVNANPQVLPPEASQPTLTPANPDEPAQPEASQPGQSQTTSLQTTLPQTTLPQTAAAAGVHPMVLAEFKRLKPDGVTVIGSLETAQMFFDLYQEAGNDNPAVTQIATDSTAWVSASVAEVVQSLGNSGNSTAAPPAPATLERMVLPRPAGQATPVRLRQAIASRAVLEPVSLAAATDADVVTIDPLTDPAVLDPASELAATATSTGPTWLVPADQPVIAILAQPALTAIGGDLLYVDPADLRGTATATLSQLTEATELRLVGPMPVDYEWQLEVITTAPQLPGGGYLLFPDRRIVAMYGHINSTALGVLGEQDPAAGVDRAHEIATGYDADGVPVVTAFEIITTLASAHPNYDDSYSVRTPVADLLPWIEQAADAGMYVILDLQPGRTDFLTQAKEYEELLQLPHVGLALDPEWRLKPDQVHLRQVGTVDSSEVNQVIDWLANLVREHALPQKLLMVHQFHFAMITNREDIKTPTELAVMIHMDGQGHHQTKFTTYAQLTEGTTGNGWWWGWKNFYHEDFPQVIEAPGPLPPERVLPVRPIPYLISFQ